MRPRPSSQALPSAAPALFRVEGHARTARNALVPDVRPPPCASGGSLSPSRSSVSRCVRSACYILSRYWSLETPSGTPPRGEMSRHRLHRCPAVRISLCAHVRRSPESNRRELPQRRRRAVLDRYSVPGLVARGDRKRRAPYRAREARRPRVAPFTPDSTTAPSPAFCPSSDRSRDRPDRIDSKTVQELFAPAPSADRGRPGCRS